MKIRLSNQMINDYFELYYSKHFAGVCHTQMQYQKTGIAMEGLNTRIVKGLWMIVPPLDEQKAIGEYLESLDTLITLHQHKLDKLKDLKQAMLNKLFVKGGN